MKTDHSLTACPDPRCLSPLGMRSSKPGFNFSKYLKDPTSKSTALLNDAKESVLTSAALGFQHEHLCSSRWQCLSAADDADVKLTTRNQLRMIQTPPRQAHQYGSLSSNQAAAGMCCPWTLVFAVCNLLCSLDYTFNVCCSTASVNRNHMMQVRSHTVYAPDTWPIQRTIRQVQWVAHHHRLSTIRGSQLQYVKQAQPHHVQQPLTLRWCI